MFVTIKLITNVKKNKRADVMIYILPSLAAPITDEADLELINEIYRKHYGLMVMTIRCYGTELP